MLQRTEETEVYLAARWYLAVLFQNLLGNEPSSEQFEAIDTRVAAEALQELLREEAGAAARFPTLLSEADTDALKSEYTRLFIGPHTLKAPPWESMYATREQRLFTRETLEVRNFYRSQGLITAEYPRVADDHVAIELDFMAQLAKRALDGLTGEPLDSGESQETEAEAAEVTEEALRASLVFLEEHLLKWIPKYVDALHTEEAHFYPEVAGLLLLFLRKDAESLHAILDT